MSESDTNKDGVTDMAEAVAGGEEHMAAQKADVDAAAEAEAERAAAAAADAPYPRVMSSGGASDDLWVYPSCYTFEYNTEAECQTALDAARADNPERYTAMMDPATGAYIIQSPGGWQCAYETDTSTRYSTSDHEGGK